MSCDVKRRRKTRKQKSVLVTHKIEVTLRRLSGFGVVVCFVLR